MAGHRSSVIVDVPAGGNQVHVALSRPSALNAITPTMLDELSDVLDEVAAMPAVRVVVLTGAGRAFSAGVDLKALGGVEPVDGAVGDVLDVPARRVMDQIARLPAVVIAKVNGFCFAGALELALACDVIVCADEARLGDTHAKWGLRPTWGMSQRLAQRAGQTRARVLSYTAQAFTGREAAQWGIACASHPLAELDAQVAEMATAIAANSRGSLAAYKDLYRAAADMTLSDGLSYEFGTHYPIDDTQSRVATFH